VEEMKTKECIACAETIQVKAVLCKHCGVRQDDESFMKSGPFNWNVYGYPTPEDEISEEWVEASEQLLQAFKDLGLPEAIVEARNDGVNHVLFFEVCESAHHIAFGSDRWLQIEIINGEQAVIDDGISNVGPLPPRALAINTLSWLVYFLVKKSLMMSLFNQIAPGSVEELGTEFQANLATLTIALARAKEADFWMSLEPPAEIAEAAFLGAIAELAEKGLHQRIETELTQEKLVETYIGPMFK
jgi:hypothetical protein